jgi:hypothetical protein
LVPLQVVQQDWPAVPRKWQVAQPELQEEVWLQQVVLWRITLASCRVV